MDNFEVLGLKRRLALGGEEVREAFHALSRDEHPDVTGEESRFGEITEAYAVLSNPVRRLKHFIDLEFPVEGERRGREMISGDLLDLFGEVNEVIQEADAYLKKKAACRTALGRAMLGTEEIERQRALSDLQGRLSEEMEKAESQFADIDAAMMSDRERARQVSEELARRMSYLSKWLEQVREKFASLF